MSAHVLPIGSITSVLPCTEVFVLASAGTTRGCDNGQTGSPKINSPPPTFSDETLAAEGVPVLAGDQLNQPLAVLKCVTLWVGSPMPNTTTRSAQVP